MFGPLGNHNCQHPSADVKVSRRPRSIRHGRNVDVDDDGARPRRLCASKPLGHLASVLVSLPFVIPLTVKNEQYPRVSCSLASPKVYFSPSVFCLHHWHRPFRFLLSHRTQLLCWISRRPARVAASVVVVWTAILPSLRLVGQFVRAIHAYDSCGTYPNCKNDRDLLAA